MAEVQTLISQIKQMAELNETQKDELIALVDEAKVAVEEEDETKKEQCKRRFEVFKNAIGKHGFKVLDILAKCAAIAGVLFGR
ncbi:MAG: hypothetical protein LBC12_00890 [Nitrososphaerota archaeon]|jgi:hypothetical protein|nr:hypothetical protein [Nitrososphaerota archaeon]